MRVNLNFIVICASLMGSVAIAETQPVVVELYTSQGCSSCPPADEMLTELADRPGVIALALHVDYWDYIGWKDVFANPDFTRRQQGYAHSAGASTIYTPQMVIGGVDHVIGSRPMEVADQIQRQSTLDHGISLKILRSGNTLAITAENADAPMAMVVQIVRLTANQKVAIDRGENAGKEIVYSNIVNSWKVAGAWDGVAPLDMRVTIEGSDPVVVLIQRGTSGPIVAAARLP